MSNLELLIKESRRVWEQMGIEPKLMDEMVDSLANPKIDSKIIDKLTDEGIVLSTQKYINAKQEKEKQTQKEEKGDEHEK